MSSSVRASSVTGTRCSRRSRRTSRHVERLTEAQRAARRTAPGSGVPVPHHEVSAQGERRSTRPALEIPATPGSPRDGAVHDDRLDAVGERVRFVELRSIVHGPGSNSTRSATAPSPIRPRSAEPEPVGGQRGHLPHRRLQGEHPVPHGSAQHARERAVRRVGGRARRPSARRATWTTASDATMTSGSARIVRTSSSCIAWPMHEVLRLLEQQLEACLDRSIPRDRVAIVGDVCPLHDASAVALDHDSIPSDAVDRRLERRPPRRPRPRRPAARAFGRSPSDPGELRRRAPSPGSSDHSTEAHAAYGY